MANRAIPDWPKIRHAWSTGEKSIADLARDYGVNRASIYRRKKLENWQKLDATQSLSSASRITRIIELQISQLEKQLQAVHAGLPDTASPADLERNVKTLTALVKTLEQLNQNKPPDAADNSAAQTRLDQNELRNQLYQRMVALSEQGSDSSPA